MQAEPNRTLAEKDDATDSEVLSIMLYADKQWPWSVEEIVRELGSTDAVDAVARLAGAGLLHRIGDFIFPTRAAIYYHEVVER
jgi:hypothetical protein